MKRIAGVVWALCTTEGGSFRVAQLLEIDRKRARWVQDNRPPYVTKIYHCWGIFQRREDAENACRDIRAHRDRRDISPGERQGGTKRILQASPGFTSVTDFLEAVGL